MATKKQKQAKKKNMAGAKIKVGDIFPLEQIVTMDGKVIKLRKSQGMLHLHLARYTGCPVCNFHFKHFANRIDQVKDAGIESIFVLHSDKDDIVEHQLTMSWTTALEFVSDPKEEVYAAVGLKPLSAWEMIKSIPRAIRAINEVGKLITRKGNNHGGEFSRPADLLIDKKTGKILEFKVARSQGDRWEVGDVIIKATLAVSRASSVAEQDPSSS